MDREQIAKTCAEDGSEAAVVEQMPAKPLIVVTVQDGTTQAERYELAMELVRAAPGATVVVLPHATSARVYDGTEPAARDLLKRIGQLDNEQITAG